MAATINIEKLWDQHYRDSSVPFPVDGSGGGGDVNSVAGKTGDVTLVEGDVANLTTDLASKAPLASAALTGAPTAPTPSSSDNSTTIATTAFVQTAVGPFAQGTGNYFQADWETLWGLDDGEVLAASGLQDNVENDIFGGENVHTYDHTISQDAGRITWAVSPRRGGFGSVLLEVQSGDVSHSGSERVALEATGNTNTWLYPGDDVWIAQSFLFPNGYVVNPTVSPDGWLLLFQLFSSSTDFSVTGGSPQLAIEVGNTTIYGSATMDLQLAVRGGDKPNAGAGSPGEHYTHFAPATQGAWHDVLIHLRLGETVTSNGEVQVYHRLAGQAFPVTPQIDYSGPNVQSINGGSALPAYFEMNLYRSARAETQRVYFGGQIVRTTRQEAQEFFYDFIIPETPSVKQIHASGLSSGAIDALFVEETPQDTAMAWDLDDGVPMVRVAGTWESLGGVSQSDSRQRDLMAAIGLITASGELGTMNASTVLTTQVAYGSAVYLYAGEVVTYIAVCVGTAGGGTTPSTIKAGLWSSASSPVVLALSSDYSADSMWTSLGTKLVPLTAPYTVLADGLYYPSMWENGVFGTTAMKLVGVNNTSGQEGLGGGGSSAALLKRPFTALKTASSLTVADTGTYATSSGTGFWMAVA